MIEVIPNISEGRRQAVIDAMTTAVLASDDIFLLDASSDPSHNRTVLTMVGDEEPLMAALLRLYAVAVAKIDLREHEGVHPRIGAVDVVPFVPLGDTTMAQCATLSRRLAAAVSDCFEVPVYLYGEATQNPQRRGLEDVRHGEFENLALRMANATWTPDFGGSVPHPTAGASAIGARDALIALNVNLESDDLEVARDIARRVRERDGGLAGVKALGVPLFHRGIVQVSMNVTDYKRSPLEQILAYVDREAQKLGIRVLESEIVGLLPAESLRGIMSKSLRVKALETNKLLEVSLARKLLAREARSSGAS